MKTTVILPLALAVAFAAGCTSVPTKDIEIRTEAAPTARLSGYKSYAWLAAATLLNDPAGQWQPRGFAADVEIKFLIDRELRGRGLSETSVDPDMLVAFAAGVDMQALDLKTDPTTKLEVLTNVPRSGLLVVLIDRRTGFAIWAGVAGGEVQTQLDTAMAKARLDYAITKMLGQCPW